MTQVPDELAIDSGGDAVPTSDEAPRLSWRPVAQAERYEVRAEVDDEPLPIRTVVGHTLVAWPWEPLRSGQHVVWRVRAAGHREWSAGARFEVGLLDADWRAEWVGPGEDDDPGQGRRPAYVLTKDFAFDGDVARARLYSTALGVYTAALNGRRVGDVELAPGSTSYDRTVYAQLADVTGLLRQGANRIELELSDGWFRGQVAAFRVPATWGGQTALRAELHVDLVDGRRLVVRTDGSWTSRRSAVVRADLMDGQNTDLTAPHGDARPVRVGVADAPPVAWSPAPPVRVVATRQVAGAHEIRPGVWVLDFGQNASGRVRMSDLGPRGTRTVLDYGEHLASDGDLTTAHLDSHKPGEPTKVFVQRDEVVSRGQDDAFEPRHTVHGFRYVRVTREGAALDPATTVMQVMHTDLRRTGAFTCSDDDLNRLHANADWSFRGNAVDVPTDCPTRERVGWTGDFQIFAPTATRLYDVLGFARKWLRSVRDDQLDDGRIANFSPDGRRIKRHLDEQFAMMTGSAGWGDAIVAVPWELYESYGDELVLAENWDAMVRWVEWALEQAATTRHHARVLRSPEPEPFERFLWDGTFHWGEWTEPKTRGADGRLVDPIEDDPVAWFMADKGEVGTAYLYRSLSTLARIASVLGRAEGRRYAALADEVRAAWRAAYLDADGTTSTDTQAAYVRALSFGLVPDDLREAALDRLVALIGEADGHLGTGFLSTGDLLPVLADGGRADVAHAVLMQRTPPSWLAMVERGATTVWEDWEGVDENGDAHASLNHYSKGAVVRFLHTHTLGLRQEVGSAGWRRAVIAPVPGAGVTWARGFHDGPQGRIAVRWQLDGDVLALDVDIPPLTTARVVLPDGSEREVGPGTHALRSPVAAFAASR
jgi:alpha-L-rhamnosidase